MRNELIFQHNIVLEYEEINYEFEMLRLLLQEAKKSGFRNKFRDLEEYIDMRFQGISHIQ